MAAKTSPNFHYADGRVVNSQQFQAQPPNTFLPCVIPQISKSFRGAFYSPFLRAYAPQLETCGISQEEFLAMIDGLNQVFIAHPIFTGLNIAGAVMGQFYGLHPVQWAGAGLQFAAGSASAATSFFRTRAYVQAINETLFQPVGLQLQMLTTAKMMAKIGLQEKSLKLPPLTTTEVSNSIDADGTEHSTSQRMSPNDPRMRWLDALKGHVMPLDFDVPDAVLPDNLIHRMGAKKSAKLSEKQLKKTGKGEQGAGGMFEKEEEEFRKGDEKIAEKQQEADQELAKLERKLNRESNPSKQEKLRREYEKEKFKLLSEVEEEVRKRDEKVAKERRKGEKKGAQTDKKGDKTVNKIRWLVIVRRVDEDASGGMTSGDESE